MKVAPILVIVAVVVTVVAIGESIESGHRGENAPTPVFVAARFIPTGTPGERIHPYLVTTGITLPRKERPNDSIDDLHYLSGRVTVVNIYPGQALKNEFFGLP